MCYYQIGKVEYFDKMPTSLTYHEHSFHVMDLKVIDLFSISFYLNIYI